VERPKSNPPSEPPQPADAEAAPEAGRAGGTGRVKFDDRGNAVWEWSISTGAFGLDVSTGRLKKLENPALSIADDSSPSLTAVKPHAPGARKGYDPYDSGKVGKTAPKPEGKPKKRDLKRLGEWIALRKQANANKDDKK